MQLAILTSNSVLDRMDNKIKDIIAETAKELGITEFKTTKVVENLFNFMRNSMTKLEHEEYYIPKFGKFNIIKKRYEVVKNKINKTNAIDKNSDN